MASARYACLVLAVAFTCILMPGCISTTCVDVEATKTGLNPPDLFIDVSSFPAGKAWIDPPNRSLLLGLLGGTQTIKVHVPPGTKIVLVPPCAAATGDYLPGPRLAMQPATAPAGP